MCYRPPKDPRPQLLAGSHFGLSPASGMCCRPPCHPPRYYTTPCVPLALAHFFGGNCCIKPFSVTPAHYPFPFRPPTQHLPWHICCLTVSHWTMRSEELVASLQHLAQRLHKVAQSMFAECVNEEGKDGCNRGGYGGWEEAKILGEGHRGRHRCSSGESAPQGQRPTSVLLSTSLPSARLRALFSRGRGHVPPCSLWSP